MAAACACVHGARPRARCGRLIVGRARATADSGNRSGGWERFWSRGGCVCRGVIFRVGGVVGSENVFWILRWM